MTHEEAIRKAALTSQRMGASYRVDANRNRDEGQIVLAEMYANWSAEQYAIARALMKIEGGEE